MKCDDDSFINIPNLIHVLNGGTIPVYNATTSFYDNSNNRLIANDDILIGCLFEYVRPTNEDFNSKW